MDPNFVIEPTHVIQRQLWEISAAGPASYNQATADVINFQSTQFPSAIPGGFLSKSGTYELKPFPSITANLRPTWAFRWVYSGAGGVQGVDGVAITTPGTGGTNGTVTINATGGGGTGAQISVTTAGGIITAVSVVNPGSGYTSAPTFTIAAGTGVVAATIGSIAGMEVATGTNLSAEQVQFFVIGGEM
jgi:hypothetical protein